MMERLCVFCGSSPGADPEYKTAARRLGALLARRSIALVFGGGNVGLMAEIANSALHQQGEVIGVIPQALVEKELAHNGVTELRIVGSMHERKAVMADLSDGFIALPGGLGTLEELFEILTWAQLGLHEKPCGLLNVLGYFAHMRTFLNHMVSQRFLKSRDLQMLLVEENEEALLQKMADYKPPRTEKWIDRSQR